VTITRTAQPGRLRQPWVQQIVPGVFRVGTTFLGCDAVDEAGADPFIDVGLPGYWPPLTRFLAARNAPLSSVQAVVLTHYLEQHPRLELLYGARYSPHDNPVERVWAGLKNYVANTAVTWPGRLRQIHAFFRNRSPDQMLDAAAPWTSPWLPARAR
jgi:hypothetical protein